MKAGSSTAFLTDRFVQAGQVTMEFPIGGRYGSHHTTVNCSNVESVWRSPWTDRSDLSPVVHAVAAMTASRVAHSTASLTCPLALAHSYSTYTLNSSSSHPRRILMTFQLTNGYLWSPSLGTQDLEQESAAAWPAHTCILETVIGPPRPSASVRFSHASRRISLQDQLCWTTVPMHPFAPANTSDGRLCRWRFIPRFVSTASRVVQDAET